MEDGTATPDFTTDPSGSPSSPSPSPSSRRARSGSTNSTSIRRSVSNSLFSKLASFRSGQSGSDNAGSGLTSSSGSEKRNVQQSDGDGSGTSSIMTDTGTGKRGGSESGIVGGEVKGKGALSSALQQQHRKTRRRKGSLRKAALLGTGVLRMEGRERRERGASSRSQEVSGDLKKESQDEGDAAHALSQGDRADGRREEEKTGINTTRDGGSDSENNGNGNGKERNKLLPFPSLPLSPDTDSTPRQSYNHLSALSSPPPLPPVRPRWLHSKNGQQQQSSLDSGSLDNNDGDDSNGHNNTEETPSTTSSIQDDPTTDEEDFLSLPRFLNPLARFSSTASTASSSIPALWPPSRREPSSLPTPSSSSDSYFPLENDHHPSTMAQPRIHRPPAHSRVRSPLATTTDTDQALPTTTGTTTGTSTNSAANTLPSEGWDYSETEWWGWIILLVTWLVFVIGMGSCFDVWSWAWDVGETPYAPPELEDDPTLPIVGYYPALMILTAVMAWVWVVVAWVGMKYFRHANITGED